MSRPRLLDLYSGAGGAAKGYQMAGFHVTGVDIRPQPRYAGDAFVLGDALAYCREHGHEFDVIHASPPCQAYSAANNIHGRTDHPDLIAVTREVLLTAGVPYIIENVPGAPLRNAITICGLALGLNVKRHRLFESNLLILGTHCVKHDADYLVVFGGSPRTRCKVVGRAKGGGPVCRRGSSTLEAGRAAMGISWMSRDELSQAIPPAYTHFIGQQLIRAIDAPSQADE